MTHPNSIHASASGRKVLRARLVLPLSLSAIHDGAVVVRGNLIESVSGWKQVTILPGDEIIDLGEVVLLPGLVNAHCHLDYTFMAGQVSPPPASFVDWLSLITSMKGGLIYSDYAESWLTGATMLVKSGTTTVGDIEMIAELLPETWSATPLRVMSFLEMTGVKSRRPPEEILGEALLKIKSSNGPRNQMGFSPHAPYSTTPELLSLAGKVSRENNIRITTHVAESSEEFEMFMNGTGKMYHWISRSGRSMDDCGKASPVQHLNQQGILGRNFLAVHANYLSPRDVEVLAETGSSVVHCPRSHFYFKHGKFPFHALSDAGVKVCLGTDSLASVLKSARQTPELNMFDEMRQFKKANPEVDAETVLKMATLNGAIALGMQGKIGELSEGAFADMIAIPFSGTNGKVHQEILDFKGNVFASMIDGNWAVVPGQLYETEITEEGLHP